MPRLPQVSGVELVRAFKRDGWMDIGQKGSHRKLVKFLEPVGKRRIIIPQHRVVKKGTLAAILRDAAVSADKLRELL